jgi:mutator protein MutT
MMANSALSRQTAALVPYRKTGNEYEIFMQRRDKNAERFPGYLGFFGGGIEDGETPETALKREIREELNIEIRNYRHLAHFEASRGGLDAYTLEVPEGFERTVTVNEGQYGKFVKFDDIFKDLVSDGARMILKRFAEVIIKPNENGK